MNRTEILELIHAGYTKEEIDAMQETTEEPVKEEKEKEEKKEAPEETKEAKEDSRLEELINAVKEMRDDLKRRSIMQDDYEVKSPQKQAEEILASVINPFGPKK